MRASPSPNGANGRGSDGRFTPGNPGGPGNPHSAQVATLRAALLEAVSEHDVREIAAKLVAMAKGGDIAAIREVLDRTIGRPKQSLEVEAPHSDDHAPDTPEEWVRRMQLMQIPEERWPPMVRAYYRERILGTPAAAG